jgi:hypothetical protein
MWHWHRSHPSDHDPRTSNAAAASLTRDALLLVSSGVLVWNSWRCISRTHRARARRQAATAAERTPPDLGRRRRSARSGGRTLRHSSSRPASTGLSCALQRARTAGPNPLRRWIVAVVDRPGRRGTITVRPPHSAISAVSARRSATWSPRLTKTSGRNTHISASGLSSSKRTTADTAASAATTRARSAAAWHGRNRALQSLRAEASVWMPTTRLLPSSRACSKQATWPAWRRSKTP